MDDAERVRKRSRFEPAGRRLLLKDHPTDPLDAMSVLCLVKGP